MERTIKITIGKNNKISVNATGGLNYVEITNALASAQLSTMKNVSALAHKHDASAEFDEQLWDHYNEMASTVLEEFIPDRMHATRDLTEEAIMELENEKIQHMS